MTIQHIVRRSAASAAAVNTAVPVDLPIDSTAATPITSPGGEIVEIVADFVRTGAEVASESVLWSVRLSGAAIPDGQQDFSCGGLTNGASSTGIVQTPSTRIVLDPTIKLKVNQPLVVQAFWNGVDIGTPMAQVELVIVS